MRSSSTAAPRRPEKVPVWKVPLDLLRSVVFLATGFLLWLVFDGWMRLTVLRYRKDEAGRIRAVNRLIRQWGASTHRLIRAVLGIRWVVEGRPPDSGRCLIVSNHQSWLDITLLITIFRNLNVKFVAADEWRRGTPAISVGLRHGGFGLVGKQRLWQDMAELRRFARQMERFDGSPLIFPEGRRAKGGLVLPFHYAGIEVVRRVSRLPIVPVTIDGPWKGRAVLQCHRLADATITVRISELIPFGEVQRDPRGTYERIEQTIRRNVDEIRQRCRDFKGTDFKSVPDQ